MFCIICKKGYCAEFNADGALIQENYNADCRKYDPPCPKYTIQRRLTNVSKLTLI